MKSSLLNSLFKVAPFYLRRIFFRLWVINLSPFQSLEVKVNPKSLEI
jgi:hypothetical protein